MKPIGKAIAESATFARETSKSGRNPFAKYGYFCLVAIFASFHGL